MPQTMNTRGATRVHNVRELRGTDPQNTALRTARALCGPVDPCGGKDILWRLEYDIDQGADLRNALAAAAQKAQAWVTVLSRRVAAYRAAAGVFRRLHAEVDASVPRCKGCGRELALFEDGPGPYCPHCGLKREEET